MKMVLVKRIVRRDSWEDDKMKGVCHLKFRKLGGRHNIKVHVAIC